MTNSTAGTSALVGQVGSVVGSLEEIETYLGEVVHAVEEATPGCDAVGVTVVQGARPFTAAYTTARTLQIDAIQYALGEGPCLEAHSTCRLVEADLDEAMDRWPRFTAAAKDFEMRAIIALPLLARDESVGALNIYAQGVEVLATADRHDLSRAASRIGEVVGAGLAVIEARELAGQLEEAMASRAVIEQAKGIIMGQHGLTETDAFDLMRQQSQRTNIKLRTLAVQIVSGVTGAAAAVD